MAARTGVAQHPCGGIASSFAMCDAPRSFTRGDVADGSA
jgi:hypothetical protein